MAGKKYDEILTFKMADSRWPIAYEGFAFYIRYESRGF